MMRMVWQAPFSKKTGGGGIHLNQLTPLARTARLVAVSIVGVLLLSACAQTATLTGTNSASTPTTGDQPSATVFPDIPIPAGAKMVVDKTLVVGADPWFGQLALEASQASPQVFDFYRSRLPEYGWQEITSVRAPVSVLTYDRDDRILQMQIKGSTLAGSEVTITVSPRGRPMPSATPPVTTIN